VLQPAGQEAAVPAEPPIQIATKFELRPRRVASRRTDGAVRVACLGMA
jgi:hypothetical protein